PRGARFGVYVAYVYYRALFRKIRAVPLERVLSERIRVRNRRKLALLTTSYLRHSLGLL
ncbi:MAG: phytoene/squalene synthase family protein, partial [Flavobacteriales bacterium]|nr:phytoene/squalene synthase family protein [Flavobacteriales bacterium]